MRAENVLFFCLMLQSLSVVHVQAKMRQISRMLIDYDKTEPPSEYSRGDPTTVDLGIYVNSFYAISEQTMDFSVSMYFRQQWTDNRLKFNKSSFGNEDSIMATGMIDDIWKPDTFMRNEKDASYHNVPNPNRLLRLHSSGRLWYVTKITAVLSCPMKLQKFPFDTQSCPIMLESFGYTMKDIVFKWLSKPVDVDRGLELPEFSMTDVILHDCSQNYTAGAFPCLSVRFVIRRAIGSYLIRWYFPCIFIVTLSWVAFWISVDATQARLFVGMMALVIFYMITQSGAGLPELPRVSYIKAIDVWTIMCFIFLLAAVIQCAIMRVWLGQPKKSAEKQAADETDDGGDGRKKALFVDKLSRVLFPVAFLIFNVIYWIIYTV